MSLWYQCLQHNMGIDGKEALSLVGMLGRLQREEHLS